MKISWKNVPSTLFVNMPPLDKLASKYYKRPEYWWIIARYNSKPTDAHYRPGDLVFIPRPLPLILKAYTK
jgi:hypothetical protein